MNRKYTVLGLLLLMLVSVACSSLNQVTPEFLDDPAIEAEVRAKIAEDVANKTFDVGVSVNDKVVTLSGEAASYDEKSRIGKAAGDVKGVKSVINNIVIKP